jgi:adenylate cyclase
VCGHERLSFGVTVPKSLITTKRRGRDPPCSLHEPSNFPAAADEEYLIKGVAGRILFRVLSSYVAEHRDEFPSKEIRLDPDIGPPILKDNLEARLIALRQRLCERTAALRIEKTGRGRFRLEISRELLLERRP